MVVASAQYELSPADLRVVLALARRGTLAAAGELLGVDASTVFRALQRVEKGLQQRLFERTRGGYRSSELGAQLARHAERIEAELEAARGVAHLPGQAVSGTVPNGSFGRYVLLNVLQSRSLGGEDFDVYFADLATAGSLLEVAATADLDDVAP